MTIVAETPTTPAASAPRRGPRLHGLVWLVWRQHRAAFWTVLAVAAVGAAWMAYRRAEMTDALQHLGRLGTAQDVWRQEFHSGPLKAAGAGLFIAPVLTGVLLGAPLFARDLESGTAALVLSQSVGRPRWLAVKLAMTALVVVVAAGVLSAVFGWCLSPSGDEPAIGGDWASPVLFDTTGPVLVALTLLTTVVGAAIGLLVRRVPVAMAATLGFTLALMAAWDRIRPYLGDPVKAVGWGDGHAGFPELPAGAHMLRLPSPVTESGRAVSQGLCGSEAQERARACLEEHGAVGWAVEYLPHSQMAAMQWTGAAVLFVLTAAVAAFVLLRGRGRVL